MCVGEFLSDAMFECEAWIAETYMTTGFVECLWLDVLEKFASFREPNLFHELICLTFGDTRLGWCHFFIDFACLGASNMSSQR